MFITDSQAEVPFAKIFGKDERMWSWIKFGINVPYYLVRLSITDGHGEDQHGFIKHLLLSDSSQLLDLKALQDESLQIMGVTLFIPNYLRDTEGYTFGNLKEVWRCADTGSHRFVVDDGEELYFHSADEGNQYELLFKI